MRKIALLCLLLSGIVQAQVELHPVNKATGTPIWRVVLYDYAEPQKCIKTIAGDDTGFSITISTDVSDGAAFTYTAAGSTVDAITTIGTYAEPATSNIAFEYTGAGCWYEIQARGEVLEVSNAERLYIDIESSQDDFIDANYWVDLNVADVSDIVSATYEEPYASHTTTDSFGELLNLITGVSTNVGTITGTNGVNLADEAITSDKIASGTEFDANVVDIDAGTIVAADFASGAVSASALATDAVNEIRDAIMQYALDNGVTFEESQCYNLAILAGEAAFTDGTPDTAVFQDPGGNDNRVSVQYGADDGDRTSITLSATDCGSN